MLQRAQRLINIKIAKAYRSISFEASCMMAGVSAIELVIQEKASQKTKHNPEYDLPLPVSEWPHPTQRWNGIVMLSEDQGGNSRIGLTRRIRSKLQNQKDMSIEQY
jgi:hypothetical protein